MKKDNIIKDIIINNKILKNHQKIETGVLFFDIVKTNTINCNNLTILYGYEYNQKCFFVKLDDQTNKKTTYYKVLNNNVLKLANRVITRLIKNKTLTYISTAKNQSNKKFKLYKGYTKENVYFSIDVYDLPIENLFIGLSYGYCSTLFPRKINKFLNENFKEYY